MSIMAGVKALQSVSNGVVLAGTAAGLFTFAALPAAPLIPIMAAGALIGAGTGAWSSYKEYKKIKHARQIKEDFGARFIESRGLEENSESIGYRLTKSYDPPQDTEYLSGVQAALEGAGKDRTGWSKAKFDGYLDYNVIALRTDEKSAEAFTNGCKRRLAEQSSSGTVETPVPAAAASSTGGGAAGGAVTEVGALTTNIGRAVSRHGVAQIIISLKALVTQTTETKSDLLRMLDLLVDFRLNYDQELSSSASGRDVVELLDSAAGAVGNSIVQLDDAIAKLEEYIEGLGR